MAHMSGSMGHYSGYGTIQIHLQDTGPLVQGTEYRYKVQGQPQEDTAIADRIQGRMVLVDSNYTIGENPPPFSAGRPLTVYVPNQSFPLVTSLITKIEALEEPKSDPNQITMKLYDGANLRTFYLREEVSVEEFMSTVLKDVPIEAIEELDSNNQTVSSYQVVKPESLQKKSQNKKKKKKSKFQLFKGKGKKIKTKKSKSRTQSPAQTRSQDGGRSATTQRPGGNGGRTY
tara:strand:+ start:38 stop:727 length:690 start_codon:yes stop_codon:yes gene_type:complete